MMMAPPAAGAKRDAKTGIPRRSTQIPYHYSTKPLISQPLRSILLFFGEITKIPRAKEKTAPGGGGLFGYFAWGRARVRVSIRRSPRERRNSSASVSSHGCSNQEGEWASQPKMTLLPTAAASSQKAGVG